MTENNNFLSMYNDKTVTVINCCDDKYETVRKTCSQSSIEVGKADRVIEYSPDMMDEDFKQKNHELLSISRGAGLWIWKPYFILKALQNIPEGHYLIYLDAGVVVISEFRSLLESLEKSNQDIMAFELPLLAEEWTKKEVYTSILPGFNGSVNQILAGYIVIRNTSFSRNMIKEWLDHMLDPVCILPETITGEANYWNFVENRDDQSVFSLVCRKHNLIPFRDPSQFGVYPFKYAWYPKLGYKWKKYSYRPHEYENSPYPQILVSNRSDDPKKKIRKEKVINFLDRIGIYRGLYFRLLKPYLSIVKRD